MSSVAPALGGRSPTRGSLHRLMLCPKPSSVGAPSAGIPAGVSRCSLLKGLREQAGRQRNQKKNVGAPSAARQRRERCAWAPGGGCHALGFDASAAPDTPLRIAAPTVGLTLASWPVGHTTDPAPKPLRHSPDQLGFACRLQRFLSHFPRTAMPRHSAPHSPRQGGQRARTRILDASGAHPGAQSGAWLRGRGR